MKPTHPPTPGLGLLWIKPLAITSFSPVSLDYRNYSSVSLYPSESPKLIRTKVVLINFLSLTWLLPNFWLSCCNISYNLLLISKDVLCISADIFSFQKLFIRIPRFPLTQALNFKNKRKILSQASWYLSELYVGGKNGKMTSSGCRQLCDKSAWPDWT